MDSEEAARNSAQLKHNKYMVFGKKFRYIEVFQCSGDDMNLVLNGGLHSPANPTKPPLLSPGMLPQTHQATSPPHQPSSGIPIGIPPPLTLSIPPPNPALIAQQQAQFIAQQNLMARQQAAAAQAAAAQAAVAAQHSEPQYYLPNLTLLQHPHHPHNHASQPNLSFQAQHAYATHPQFLFMPRPPPHMQASAAASAAAAAAAHQQLSMGLMPSPFSHGLTFASAAAAGTVGQHHHATLHPHHHQFQQQQQQQHQHHQQQQHQQHQQQQHAAAAAAAVAQHHMNASIKRSYESAFQHEQASASAPKRHFARPTTASVQSPAAAAAAAAAAASLYSPFYPPNL